MFACIHVPDFSVEAIVRSEPGLRKSPIAVLEGKPPVVRVSALNKQARRLGMQLAMTKIEAAVFAGSSVEEASAHQENSFAPGKEKQRGTSASRTSHLAVLRQRSLEQEASAHSALLDVAHAFTPRVEDTASDTLLLDLTGMERLYGDPAKVAGTLAARVNAVGVAANVALAANPDTAMHAARGFNGTTVIPAGKEAQKLGVLPVQVLLEAFENSGKKLSSQAFEQEKSCDQIAETLERWGIRNFDALARLPEQALAARLGETGVRLQRLARGAEVRMLALCEPQARFEEGMELESPIETLEPLAFVLNRLLEQLCTRLEERALAAQELGLRLQLDWRVTDEETTTTHELANVSHNVRHPSFYQRTLRLPVSMRDTKVFLKLLQLELAAHPPGAPVTKIWITAEPAPPRSAQRGLFLPVSPEAEKLEITLARISAVVGERRAGIARLLNHHRRECFAMERFSVGDLNRSCSSTMPDNLTVPLLALRLLRPPLPLTVFVSEGRPTRLASEAAFHGGKLQGVIVWSAGPWRSSGDWWMEISQEQPLGLEEAGAWDREEWDVALGPDGTDDMSGKSLALYRIYRDMASGRWFANASYD